MGRMSAIEKMFVGVRIFLLIHFLTCIIYLSFMVFLLLLWFLPILLRSLRISKFPYILMIKRHMS
ncbi:hypothetical protein CsSME_00020071 [Camellia sinensis var. sinensis]